jgi:cell division protein YceG involved in septum cleavage
MTSKTTKIFILVLVLVAIVAAGYYWFVIKEGGKKTVSDIFNNASAVVTLPSGSSTTDTSLKLDAAAIDAQLAGLSSDSASVDSSVQASAQ